MPKDKRGRGRENATGTRHPHDLLPQPLTDPGYPRHHVWLWQWPGQSVTLCHQHDRSDIPSSECNRNRWQKLAVQLQGKRKVDHDTTPSNCLPSAPGVFISPACPPTRGHPARDVTTLGPGGSRGSGHHSQRGWSTEQCFKASSVSSYRPISPRVHMCTCKKQIQSGFPLWEKCSPKSSTF